MIHRIPSIVPKLFPNLVWRIPTTEKVLYLTFDDGPVPGATEFVLHTLARFQAKGTFFCIGDNIRKHPDIFEKIKADGHLVGNHTFNHVNGWKSSSELYMNNVDLCDAEIKRHIPHQAVTLFRPPYGRITPRQIRAINNHRIVMWDVLSGDYNHRLAPHTCLYNTVEASRPGSIVVFHDSYKAERNMSFALPRYIEHFAERGYQFKSLPC